MSDQGYYWYIKGTEAEVDRESADVRFVMAFNPKYYMDGDQWCVLIGPNIQEGIAGFGKALSHAFADASNQLRGLK
jgi:hypothetical protein